MPRRQTRQFITFFWGDVHIKNMNWLMTSNELTAARQQCSR
jgi:hypothetical protein